MKNKFLTLSIILATGLVLAACSDKPSGKVTVSEEKTNTESTVKDDDSSSSDLEDDKALTDETDKKENDEISKDDSAKDNASSSKEVEIKERVKEAKDFNFNETLKFINANKNKEFSIDYSKINYEPAKRNKDQADYDAYKKVEEKLSKDSVKKIRMLREDKAGSTLDATVYTDTDKKLIDMIKTEEYCADGRRVTDFYFENGDLVYANEYVADIYGTQSADTTLPGKKCYFLKDVMTDCVINDKDVDFKNVSLAAKDIDDQNMDEFTRTQFNQLEEDLINRAYKTYDYVKDIPATALIYGYVGDEYGGVLSNVHMTIKSAANKYEEKLDTNGDGYFEIRVPKNSDDYYGIVCKYGDFADATVDDIDIDSETIEYSLGVIYMSEPGNNVHDVNTYLLNANAKSPKILLDGQYCVTFSYEKKDVDLKPFAINLASGKSNSDVVTVIKAGDDGNFKYYVTDQRGGKSGNPMTYEMSSSNAVVKVYSNAGLVASYQAPIGKAGTVWEVFEIKDGEVKGINNIFYEGKMEPFF